MLLKAFAALGSTWSVLAPLKGLGEDVYLIGGEPHAASTAGTFPQESREDISAAESAGLVFTRVVTQTVRRGKWSVIK